MGLNDFVITKERTLSIFILADVSGSMRGMKIQAVNKAIQDNIFYIKQVSLVNSKFPHDVKFIQTSFLQSIVVARKVLRK